MKLNATFQHQASYSNRKKIIEHDRYHYILYSLYREYPADSMVLRNKTSRHILFF